MFLFPLLLVAAVAGLVVRALQPALRLGEGRFAGLPTAVFLALRRLAAAGAVLTALLVVTAVAFGSYFYSETVASSLSRGVAEKAYVAYGGDAQGLISRSVLPKSFPYPLTELDYGHQSAVVGGPDGTYADVLAVDGGRSALCCAGTRAGAPIRRRSCRDSAGWTAGAFPSWCLTPCR